MNTLRTMLPRLSPLPPSLRVALHLYLKSGHSVTYYVTLCAGGERGAG